MQLSVRIDVMLDAFGYHDCLRIDVSRARRARAAGRRRSCASTSAAAAWVRGCCSTKGGATADPLSPEAPLIFAFSPLVGSPLTTSAKFAVVSKSPLTERFNDSLASSGFAIAGKRCGCDAIVIVGRAPRAVGARHRRRRRAPRAGRRCRAATRVRPRKRSCARGSAPTIASPRSVRRASALVRYATISHDGRHAGRGGSGAVLGSKNIKAIAVRGTQRCEWAHPRELTELSRDLSKRSFGPATAKYRELGTATNLLTFNRFGTLPTRNFQSGTFDEAPQHLARAAERRRMRARARAAWPARSAASTSTRSGNGKVRARVREPVCARLAVRRRRRRRGAARVAAVRRARHRHDQHRRHDRVRDGMRRARLARRAVADVRQRRRACCGRSI